VEVQRLTQALLGLAILIVAGWLAYQVIDAARGLGTEWEILLGDPILIGDLEDPFAYAGGESVRQLSGEGHIRLASDDVRGSARLTVVLDGAVVVLADGQALNGVLSLQSDIGKGGIVQREIFVHGETGSGESGLPEAFAQFLGMSSFDLRLDGQALQDGVRGTWTIAQALRKDDGAIRNQGLIFSPLLRDNTVFADPNQLEFTLLLYDPAESDGGNVTLHLVFKHVEIVRSPAVTTPAE